MAGYHITEIVKGDVGELSKILEEVHEAIDAEKQNCSLMVLLELSDVMGSIEMYLEKHHPNTSLEDLKIMSNITRRAFESGNRS